MLKPDDFEKGMFITVLKGAIYENFGGTSLFSFINTETKTIEDNSFKGDVLEVLAVDLPYIAVKHHDRLYSHPTSFDIRKWSFKKLSKEYVEAMKPKAE